MNTTTKHTPGPWQHHLGRGKTPRFHIQTSGGYQIASTTECIPNHHDENEAREANAQLIAAAPKLAEALAKLLNDYTETMEALNGYRVYTDGVEPLHEDQSAIEARAALTEAGLL